MNIKTIIAVFSVIVACAIVAARLVVLDPPQAFAQIKHKNADQHTAMNEAIFYHGDLVIRHPTARATIPGAFVSGGYLSITNNGTEADILIGGTTSMADKLQIHEMKVDNDVMKMRQLPDGLTIEPDTTITLRPGGLHIMFMGLKNPLTENSTLKAELDFKKNGPVEIEFKIIDARHFKNIKH